jgi:D-sedoheptulose 7-phosphate isomerase
MEVGVSGNTELLFSKHLHESFEVHQKLLSSEEIANAFEASRDVCARAYREQRKLLIAGNGGSAADAQHFAGELVSRFYFDRPALAAIALTTDSSILTAVGNDYGYEDVFARQIQALGQPGDVFIAISTSGNSPNNLKAIDTAKARGLTVIGLTGKSGGKMKPLCDICICAPSDSTPRIQECHLVIEHTLCACIEEAMFGDLRPS